MQFHDTATLIKHMKTHIRSKIEITCPFSGCGFKYKNVGSFTSHICRRHKSVSVEVKTCSNATDPACSFNSLLASVPNSNNDVPSEQIDSTNMPVVSTSDDCIEQGSHDREKSGIL